MSEIRLTPSGQLRWQAALGEPQPPEFAKLQKSFEHDWPQGLFKLAADKYKTTDSLTLGYWQGLAEHYLTGLCHIPESADDIVVEPPSDSVFSTLLLSAPPMSGGEYLTLSVLRQIWINLSRWGNQAITSAGGLANFLQTHAPQWHQVGRVCFHLAENKSNEAYPFAFLATYSTGFGSGGRVKHIPLRRAIEQYAGDKNRSALIKLLSPVEQASKQIDWVGRLVDSGEIYQPLAWPAYFAHKFLQTVPSLEDCGLTVRIPNWWKKRPRPQVSVTIGQNRQSKFGVDALLDFNVAVALNGETLSADEIKDILAGGDGLVLVKGQWIEVDREKLQEAIDHWQGLQKEAENGEISFIEGMRLLAGASSDLTNDEQADKEKQWVDISAGGALREILSGLRDPANLDSVKIGSQLKTQLRPYQQQGLSWLRFLAELGLGACLADDMGLGKTIQVLALLLYNQQNNTKKTKPSLLIVPASLLSNWRKEAERFTPSLNLTFLHPAETDRKKLETIEKNPDNTLAQSDLLITTYSMLTRQSWLVDIDWHLVILDEAQAIKNPSTSQSKAAKKLSARSRIVLTGTPVENRLGDLWSLFDFLNPGLLGSANVFKKFVKSLQDREHNQFAPLRQLVEPYILRRLKTDRKIITDLPDKIEAPCYCKLSRQQVKLYEQTVNALRSTLKNADGIARRGIVLQSLMRLKQICNHPSQLTGDGDYIASDSGKFLRLGEICDEIASRQEKALIFTQFREITDSLADYLTTIFGRTGVILHGGTAVKKRQALVEQFQSDDGPPFFILSLKAGGTGLNLTAACHVIHFDRWWNPAVENQATDRAFRIGQKHNVLVHKFITTGTVEEKIDAMITEKQKMADEILSSGKEVNLTELPDDEILRLVSLDVTRAKL
ncbi:MAG: DEAD/DEAH box helicase [Planctomycetes bacterium]|nr:DEAD/DEAH box helicase [Planctomycetota bacterium]